MIINRYIIRTIHLGTFLALLALVGLGLFFLFVSELRNLGEGTYSLTQIIKFVILSLPGEVVEFMPLAVLLGSIISLGALASNSEIIAMQASGVSLAKLINPVIQAAVILAVLSFLLADWVVPDSESYARSVKNLALEKTSALLVREGVWTKDESNVVHIGQLLPNGIARDIEIFELDEQGKIISALKAERAIPLTDGWELQQVEKSLINDKEIMTVSYERMLYQGKLSLRLLEVLMIEPRQMSSTDLRAYLSFLDENKLEGRVERMIFWQKMFAPLTIIVMCLLALPFVLGSQRQGDTGQRLLIGILLGLAFVVVEQLVVQLGTQFEGNALLIALLPNITFLGIAIYVLAKKQSLGPGRGSFFRRGQA
ncbi:MAG: LPS export ABC transporter permease LptG [Gammaproteobacteria bacterium]|nr:LPS export ABC transporter permease LptG [Gammaproteobacteria bacterium]